MPNEYSEKIQQDKLWGEAWHRAMKALRKRHPYAKQDDIEDAVQNTVEYFVEKEAEGAVKVPVFGSYRNKEAFIGMFIRRAYGRYLNLIRDEGRWRRNRPPSRPPADIRGEAIDDGFDTDDLDEARKLEMDLADEHPQFRKRERQKFIDEHKKYHLEDE